MKAKQRAVDLHREGKIKKPDQLAKIFLQEFNIALDSQTASLLFKSVKFAVELANAPQPNGKKGSSIKPDQPVTVDSKVIEELRARLEKLEAVDGEEPILEEKIMDIPPNSDIGIKQTVTLPPSTIMYFNSERAKTGTEGLKLEDGLTEMIDEHYSNCMGVRLTMIEGKAKNYGKKLG